MAGLADGLHAIAGVFQQSLESASVDVLFGYAGSQLPTDFVEVGSEGVGLDHRLSPLTATRHTGIDALMIADLALDSKGIACTLAHPLPAMLTAPNHIGAGLRPAP